MNTESEHLDPLRQKPDFDRLVTHEVKYQRLFYSPGRDYMLWAAGWIDGCEHVWTSHVEPLVKELEEWKSLEHDTNVALGRKDAELSEAQSRIRELEEDRDKFAIEFARFCQVDLRGRTFEDLMNEFKNQP